jgi:D-glycero-alpha-D-manno-heptose-7-phosphate kinase
MIISRTPYRLSFFGGGTDFPVWYREQGGAVLSTTIDKYCYLTCRYLPPFFPTKHRIVWSQIELVSELGEINHPVVRAILQELKFDTESGLEIHHQGDLPARSGMGSSSAFTVGLIKALLALRGLLVSSKELALQAIDIEQNVLKEAVGCQDQIATAFGGLNRINFRKDGDFHVEPIPLSTSRLKELEESLLLFYTGTPRFSSDIAQHMIAGVAANEARLVRMHDMVSEGAKILCDQTRSLDDFGKLLHEAWQEKRQLSKHVTNTAIDDIYDAAHQAGALGGKLMGAGGSGFMYFYVPRENQPDVKKRLAHLLHVPFCFENEGSTIIHYTA